MKPLEPWQPAGMPGIARQDSRVSTRPNWWLRLTSSGWNRPQVSVDEREMARRSRFASWIILGLLIIDVLLLPLGAGDPSTLSAIVVIALGLLIAVLLNRGGLVGLAGALIIALICGGVLGSLLSQPGGQLPLDALPAYDLLAIAVVVAASIMPPWAAFAVAATNVALIAGDYFLQPHYVDLRHDAVFYGGPGAAALALLARPIALQIILAVIAFLWVRGTQDAIRRADRAEEIAAMEHTIVEQKRQLDTGIQQILDTHVRIANGDFNARAPLTQDNILWQIAASLNNLLSRLQKAGNAEYQLRRTDEEVRRLASAIRDAQQGRQPIWPAPTGTSADLILDLIGRSGARDPRQQPQSLQAPPASYPQTAADGYSQPGPASYQHAAQGGYYPTGQMPQTNNLPPNAPAGGANGPPRNPWLGPLEDDQG
ncbi:MAG: hypothetical protein ACHQ4H_09345 [Ktedonobacterales bacterium]